MGNLKGRNLISITDFNRDEYIQVLDIAEEFEKNPIGDAFGSVQLAHFASHQAINVVNNRVLGEEIKNFLTVDELFDDDYDALG